MRISCPDFHLSFRVDNLSVIFLPEGDQEWPPQTTRILLVFSHHVPTPTFAPTIR
jgi:hypothetical protein